ncbi:MAG TPA: hypothetical protein VFZ28_06960 [Burkholderiaceae bacterium]|nr:hypothetical protein [Burkholderiaceae bacterium]
MTDTPPRSMQARRAASAAAWAAAAVLAAALPARAADAQPAAQSAKARQQQREDRAKGLALGQETAQRISEAQLQIADRVLTGDAACEFDQTVSVLPIAGQPGHFRLTYKRVSYSMVPEETSSGAVRLEDKKAGIVWLQIPSKSMLMNARIGQRMVDGCMHAEQRAAVAAARGAAGAKP